MDIFDNAIPSLIKDKEGEYTNDPDDPGGPTKYGVTQARARAVGYTGDMRNLSYDQAISIFRLFYWEQPQFNALALVSPTIAAYALDTGINLGTTWPGRFLQRALNILVDGEPLTLDGNAFLMTRSKLKTFLQARGKEGEAILFGMIKAQTSVRYIELAEANVKLRKDEYGWQRARAQIGDTVKV